MARRGNHEPTIEAQIVEEDGEEFLVVKIPMVPAYMSESQKMTLLTESEKFLITTAKWHGKNIIICSGVLAGTLNR